jgi:hypothetical protein
MIVRRLESRGIIRRWTETNSPRIEATLLAAIAAAKVVLQDLGVGTQFSEVVRHTRELHDVLLEMMVANEPDVVERLRGLCESLGNAIDELELVDFLADRRRQ